MEEIVPAEVLDDLSIAPLAGERARAPQLRRGHAGDGRAVRPARRRPCAPPKTAPSDDALFGLKFKDARVEAINRFERAYLEALLGRCDQNVSRAARESDIHRSYLNEMLKKHRLR